MRGSCWTGAPSHLLSSSSLFILRQIQSTGREGETEEERGGGDLTLFPFSLFRSFTAPTSRLPSILPVVIYRDSEGDRFPNDRLRFTRVQRTTDLPQRNLRET